MQYGFLNKLGKGKTGYFQKRWVFITSARSLYTDKAFKDDTCIINDFPDWLKPECVHYFRADHDDDKTPALGRIDLMYFNKLK